MHFDDGEDLTSGPITVPYAPEAVREALLDFFQREHAGVIAFLMTYGAIRQDAEDAAQEAFADAWVLTTHPGDWERIAYPRAWIRTVALRKYHRPAGRRKRVKEILTSAPLDRAGGAGTVDHGELAAQTEFVRSILRDLAPDVRAVMAYHVDGFPSVQIACHLNMTDQQVRDLTKKGRRALKAGLGALMERGGRQSR